MHSFSAQSERSELGISRVVAVQQHVCACLCDLATCPDLVHAVQHVVLPLHLHQGEHRGGIHKSTNQPTD